MPLMLRMYHPVALALTLCGAAVPAQAADDLRVEVSLEGVSLARADGLDGRAAALRLTADGAWTADDVEIRQGAVVARAARVDGSLRPGDWRFYELRLSRGTLAVDLHEATGDPALGIYRGQGGVTLDDGRLRIEAPEGVADLRRSRVTLGGGVRGAIQP